MTNVPDPEQLASAFPVIVGARELACRGVEEGPDGPELVFDLSLRENGEVVHSIEMPVALRGLGTIDPALLAARARERLALPRFEHATPIHLVAPPFASVACAASLSDDEALRAVDIALDRQALDTGFELRLERVHLWPEAARTHYFLSVVEGSIAGNGLETFLGQALFDEIVGVRDALEASGCVRLLERLRQGITLAFSQGGELAMQTDEEWVAQEGLEVPDGPERPWARIDGHEEGRTYWLIEHEVRPRRLAYFAAHRAEIVADGEPIVPR
jgi:hypothetical protein